jgi:gamma-glutamyl-gamma-aminobutyrate hydrolase PuuD
MTKEDILILEGGSDISPEIYGEKQGKFTIPSARKRDAYEIEAFRRAQDAGAAVIGICRGAQLATALLGAPLIQHVNGHESGPHKIKLDTGETLLTSSVHHQMMYPFALNKDEYRLIAWSDERKSTVYLNGKNENIINSLPEDFVEPEIVWYPGIRTLAIQGHPEYQQPGEQFRTLCVNLAKELIINA